MSTQEIGALVDSVNQLTSTVSAKMTETNEKVAAVEEGLSSLSGEYSQTISDVEVYKQGRKKMFFLTGSMNSGGHTSETGPDAQFPSCGNPQPPSFLSMLEFVAGSGFGSIGDVFRVEFQMAHRGMAANSAYYDHFVFTGVSWADSVAGKVEIKSVSTNGAISLFVSQPSNDAYEVPITKDMEGTVIPVSFRDIGSGYDDCIARIMLKMDTRYYCGSGREFGVDVFYTSAKARPSPVLITTTQPRWDA